jgi:hypothetical protein
MSHALCCAVPLAYWDCFTEDHGSHTFFKVMDSSIIAFCQYPIPSPEARL